MRCDIFLVSKEKFFSDYIKKTLAEVNYEVYIYNESDDFSFLINDLKPRLVLLDSRACDENLEQVWNNITWKNFFSVGLASAGPGLAIKVDDTVTLPINADQLKSLAKKRIEGN